MRPSKYLAHRNRVAIAEQYESSGAKKKACAPDGNHSYCTNLETVLYLIPARALLLERSALSIPRLKQEMVPNWRKIGQCARQFQLIFFPLLIAAKQIQTLGVIHARQPVGSIRNSGT
jgi:hypothetical protein